MKIWFDTEFFEDGHTIGLISIGMVREDGQVFYEETKESRWLCQKSEWLIGNVLPHLSRPYNERSDRTELGQRIVAFSGENPEFWAYYADYDWVVLCQLFGRMIDLPKDWPMYCRDVKQLCDDVGNPPLIKQTEGPEHNALADALWAKKAWEYLTARPIAERRRGAP